MKKKSADKQAKTVRQRLTNMLELPEDVVLTSPKVTVTGTRQALIENYRAVMEYTGELMRVQTPDCTISIEGNGMEICAITDTDILIEGAIQSVRWE